MASRKDDDEQGYDRNRFIGRVKEDLICCICKDVLKDPRLCQKKEHPFCLACILRCLQSPESCRCPICREPLTTENLKRPSRFFMNCLSELELSCNYNVRGCPENVQLGNLNDHVRECGYGPVTCNRCKIRINRRDKKNHDRSACQIEPAKCHDCSVIKASLDGMRQELYQIKANENEIKELINSESELHQYVYSTNTKLDASIKKLDDTSTKLDAMSAKLDATNTKLSGMEGHITGIRKRQDETNDKVNKIRKIKVGREILSNIQNALLLSNNM